MTFVRERAEKFDLGRIVSRTLQTIQANLAAFYALALVSYGAPSALVQMLQVGSIAHLDHSSPFGSVFSATAVLSGLVSFIAKAFCSCFLISGALASLEGRPQTVGAQVRAGLPVVLPVIGIQILSGIAIGATSLLLVVPGFIVLCMLSVAVPAEVAERTGVLGAMSRSAVLTKGHRWSILGVLALFFVAIGVIGAVIGLVVGLVFYGGKSYLNADASPLAYVGVIVTALSSALFTMLSSVGVAALYAELRLVKDGPQTQALAEVFA